jgi:arylsulfatase A-like enzyme
VLLEDASTKPSWIASRPPPTAAALSRMRHGIRQQAREVHDLDGVIRELCAALDAAGRLERTIVAFASDGGVHYGEQRIGIEGAVTPARKNQPYDVCARVPCVLRGAGFAPGQVRREPAVLQDLTATVLAALGASATVELDGTDLRDPASGLAGRATLYERRGDEEFPDGVGIVDAARKVLRWAGHGDDRFEAYDLDTDPDELVSWANDPARRAERDAYEARLDALLV